MILSLFRNLFALLVVMGLLLPGLTRAQNIAEGTPLTPAFQDVTASKPDILSTKLNLHQTYDTNLVATQTGRLSGTYSQANADFRFIRQRSGRVWILSYEGGGNIYPQPKYSNLDSSLNDVHLQMRNRITSRLNFTLLERWGSIPSGAFGKTPTNQTFDRLGTQDENVDFLARRHIVNESSVAFQYRSSAHTYFSWGGNFDSIRYQPNTLFRSRSVDAYGAVYYQFTRSQTIGLAYSHQWINFPGQSLNARIHNLLGNYSNKVAPTLSMSFFGGPAFADQTFFTPGTPNRSGSDSRHNFVGGARVNKEFGRANVVLGYDRMFSRGSGLVGTTLRQTSSLTFSRKLSRHFSAGAHLNYTDNSSQGVARLGYSSYRIQPTLRYQMRPRVWFTFSEGYARGVGVLVPGTLSRNIITFGFEYSLSDLILEK